MNRELKNRGIKNAEPYARKELDKILDRLTIHQDVSQINHIVTDLVIEAGGDVIRYHSIDDITQIGGATISSANMGLYYNKTLHIFDCNIIDRNLYMLYVFIHEFGHFIMHKYNTGKSTALIEYEADAFVIYILSRLFPGNMGELLDFRKANGKYSRTYIHK